MIIRLPVVQIPIFWVAIKFAIAKIYDVKAENFRSVFNYSLHKLLNDKAQCWIRLDDERRLIALTVTEIQIDKISGDKNLFVSALYSWKHVDDSKWSEDFKFIMDFAKNEGCKQILCESDIPRCWELYKICGFKEGIRRFSLTVGE